MTCYPDVAEDTPHDSVEKGFVNRRQFLQGVTGVGAVALAGSGLAAGEPNTTVNLGDEGLSPGDDLTPYLEEYWKSGMHVIIPEGRYGFSGDGDAFAIDADEDSWLEGEGLVVLDTGYDFLPIRANNGAHVRLENLEWDEPLDARIRTWTTSTDSTIELVNLNLHGDPGTDEAGVYGAGDGENVGTLRFINCLAENFSDGLYMSSMFEGHPEDGQAVVEVYGGLYRNCTSGNVRVGGHDSKVIGVTSVSKDVPSGISNTKPLKIREAGENQIVRDCDFYVSDEGAVGDMILITSDKFEGDRGTSVLIEDCRLYADCDDDYVNVTSSGTQVEGRNLHLTGSLCKADTGETLEGSGPYSDIVTGSDADMPTMEKRLVDPDTLEPIDDGGDGSGDTGGDTGGDDSDGDSGDDSEEDTEDDTTASEHNLEIATFENSGIVYAFTVAGSIAGGDAAELDDNDSITDNGDGTMTAEGETGHGYVDDYVFEGEVVDCQVETHPDDDSGEHELVLDGTVVTAEELVGDSEEDTEDDSGSGDDSDSGGDGTPAIDRYEVSEAGSQNPHADILAEWDVSDPDGDLASVNVAVVDSTGGVVDETRTDVDGESAYDVNYFKVKNVDGQSFDVRTTVTDAQGNSTSATETVTE